MTPEYSKPTAKKSDAEQARDQWIPGYCLTNWCRSGRWFSRRDVERPSLWLMAEQPATTPWAVAADGPTCPLCGHRLEPHPEGLDLLHDDEQNPLVSFIHSLS